MNNPPTPDILIDAATGISIRELSGRDGSQSEDNATGNRRFLVRGSSDPLACRAVLLLYATNLSLLAYDGLAMKTLSWNLYPEGGPDAWEFTAAYDFTPEPGEFVVSIDTTGATVNVQEAFAQTKFNATNFTAIDYGTSINVDSQGNPQGVEKIIPSLKLNIKATIKKANFSSALAYAKVIAGFTGKVNHEAFLGFARGELLFLGATGDIITDENPTLDFAFEASVNITNQTIGSITGINKLGWEYIWFDFAQKQDTTTKLKKTIARGAYVAEIYEFANFTGLFIGV